jgi:UDP-glucose 4-epimerase
MTKSGRPISEMKVLVTGANGFVGSHLCPQLEQSGCEVIRAVRGSVGNIDGKTDWSAVLRSVDVVVHLAARVHIMNDTAGDPLTAFRKVNTDGTLNLARQAIAAGVKRFVFVSTIKADRPDPDDAYGISKYEAEQGLMQIAAQTEMETVIIRPPLVYGPGVGVNFLRLMKLAGSGIPLPLASVHNRRSLVYVGNLCDLIFHCLENPSAAGQTFFVSDGRDISTPELLRLLAEAQHKKARLFPMPGKIIRTAGRLSGRSAEIERLCGSLQVDISYARKTLGWTPPFEFGEGIRKTVDWFTR